MQINREPLSKLVQQQEHQPWIIWICYIGGSVRLLVFCLSLLSVLCFVEVFLYPLVHALHVYILADICAANAFALNPASHNMSQGS